MGVYPTHNFGGIRLATGEHFCHPRELLGDQHLIAATLSVVAAKTAKDYTAQWMLYHEGGEDYHSELQYDYFLL
jgi:hypothetical protein